MPKEVAIRLHNEERGTVRRRHKRILFDSPRDDTLVELPHWKC